MSLAGNSNQLFLPVGVQQTRKIAHISQFGPYTICFVCSKEASHRDASFEQTENTLMLAKN